MLKYKFLVKVGKNPNGQIYIASPTGNQKMDFMQALDSVHWQLSNIYPKGTILHIQFVEIEIPTKT